MKLLNLDLKIQGCFTIKPTFSPFCSSSPWYDLSLTHWSRWRWMVMVKNNSQVLPATDIHCYSDPQGGHKLFKIGHFLLFMTIDRLKRCFSVYRNIPIFFTDKKYFCCLWDFPFSQESCSNAKQSLAIEPVSQNWI